MEEESKVEVRGGKNNPLLFEQDFPYEPNIYTKRNEFLVSVCDLYIFDKNENLILKIKTLIDCIIKTDYLGGTLEANDATFNYDLYKFINSNDKNIKSDYEYILSNKSGNIVFNKNHKKECKLVAIGEIRGSDGSLSKKIIFNMPNAKLEGNFDISLAANGVSSTSIKATFDAFNDNGDIFEMILE
jgi:hypothetical protein